MRICVLYSYPDAGYCPAPWGYEEVPATTRYSGSTGYYKALLPVRPGMMIIHKPPGVF